MRSRKHFCYRYVVIGLYFLLFTIYIVVGLQPVEATTYEINGRLIIPSIDLDSDVAKLSLRERNLDTPDRIVGGFSHAKNKTFLIGHSTTVFRNLDDLLLQDRIIYNDTVYHVNKIETLTKSDIDMDKILAASDKDTLIIMTCAGELLGGGDATHRLIVSATVE